MEATNTLIAFRRLEKGLETLAGEDLEKLRKADSPKDLTKALEQVRSRLNVVQRNLDKLLPEKELGEVS